MGHPLTVPAAAGPLPLGRPARVLHLIHSQQPRGAELFSSWLAELLSPQRFQSMLCSLYVSRESFGATTVPLHCLGGKGGRLERCLGWDPLVALRLRALLRRWQPDLVVGHGSRNLKYTALAKHLRPSARTVYRNIGMASYWARSRLKVRFNRSLLRRIDAVVSVSESSRRDFIRLYRLPEDMVTTIFTGVDASRFLSVSPHEAEHVRWTLGLMSQDLVLIAVGSLTPEKGHADLLPIMRRLRGHGLSAHLLVVGDGPLRQRIAAQAEAAGVAQAVQLLGARHDVPLLLHASDLFVLPSRTEGMAAVLIEAGLAGLPSVTYHVGGVREVVQDGETGLVVPPGDVAAFGDAVLGLLRDPGRRARMGAAARAACMRFDMRTIASEYEAVFTRLLAGTPA